MHNVAVSKATLQRCSQSAVDVAEVSAARIELQLPTWQSCAKVRVHGVVVELCQRQVPQVLRPRGISLQLSKPGGHPCLPLTPQLCACSRWRQGTGRRQSSKRSWRCAQRSSQRSTVSCGAQTSCRALLPHGRPQARPSVLHRVSSGAGQQRHMSDFVLLPRVPNMMRVSCRHAEQRCPGGHAAPRPGAGRALRGGCGERLARHLQPARRARPLLRPGRSAGRQGRGQAGHPSAPHPAQRLPQRIPAQSSLCMYLPALSLTN